MEIKGVHSFSSKNFKILSYWIKTHPYFVIQICNELFLSSSDSTSKSPILLYNSDEILSMFENHLHVLVIYKAFGLSFFHF